MVKVVVEILLVVDHVVYMRYPIPTCLPILGAYDGLDEDLKR